MNSITDLVSNLQNGQIRFITFDLRTKQFKVQNTAELTFTNPDLYNFLFGAIIDTLQKQVDLWKRTMRDFSASQARMLTKEKNYRCFQKIRDAASEGMDSVQVVLPGSTAVWLLEHLGYVVKHYLYYFME